MRLSAGRILSHNQLFPGNGEGVAVERAEAVRRKASATTVAHLDRCNRMGGSTKVKYVAFAPCTARRSGLYSTPAARASALTSAPGAAVAPRNFYAVYRDAGLRLSILRDHGRLHRLAIGVGRGNAMALQEHRRLPRSIPKIHAMVQIPRQQPRGSSRPAALASAVAIRERTRGAHRCFNRTVRRTEIRPSCKRWPR